MRFGDYQLMAIYTRSTLAEQSTPVLLSFSDIYAAVDAGSVFHIGSGGRMEFKLGKFTEISLSEIIRDFLSEFKVEHVIAGHSWKRVGFIREIKLFFAGHWSSCRRSSSERAILTRIDLFRSIFSRFEFEKQHYLDGIRRPNIGQKGIHLQSSNVILPTMWITWSVSLQSSDNFAKENVTFPDFDLDATDVGGTLAWEEKGMPGETSVNRRVQTHLNHLQKPSQKRFKTASQFLNSGWWKMTICTCCARRSQLKLQWSPTIRQFFFLVWHNLTICQVEPLCWKDLVDTGCWRSDWIHLLGLELSKLYPAVWDRFECVLAHVGIHR